MPLVQRKVWTNGRKWMGNVVPGVLSLPFGAIGGWLWRPDNPFAPGPLLLLVGFPLMGWLSLGLFGFWSNAAMRDALGRQFGRERGRPEDVMWFVGYASPTFRSALDPHEDVGFLIFHEDALEFFGETERFSLPRSAVEVIVLKPNTHSWVFLGGWVEVQTPERTVRFEPRQSDLLLLNRMLRKQLLQTLTAWKNEKIVDPRKNP